MTTSQSEPASSTLLRSRPSARSAPTGSTPASPPTSSGTESQTSRHQEIVPGTLIVGRGIEISGKIERCRSLIVEGKAEASFEAETLTVAAEGVFLGQASVQDALVEGECDGTLDVHGLLRISETGRVKGTIRCAEVEVARGGKIIGDIEVGEPVKKKKQEATS